MNYKYVEKKSAGSDNSEDKSKLNIFPIKNVNF
jgi:hypothetical protein